MWPLAPSPQLAYCRGATLPHLALSFFPHQTASGERSELQQQWLAATQAREQICSKPSWHSPISLARHILWRSTWQALASGLCAAAEIYLTDACDEVIPMRLCARVCACARVSCGVYANALACPLHRLAPRNDARR